MARLKISASLENFNPGGRSLIFSIFGPLLGFGKKGFFWKRGLFGKVHFLEVLENLEILEILETP